MAGAGTHHMEQCNKLPQSVSLKRQNLAEIFSMRFSLRKLRAKDGTDGDRAAPTTTAVVPTLE